MTPTPQIIHSNDIWNVAKSYAPLILEMETCELYRIMRLILIATDDEKKNAIIKMQELYHIIDGELIELVKKIKTKFANYDSEKIKDIDVINYILNKTIERLDDIRSCDTNIFKNKTINDRLFAVYAPLQDIKKIEYFYEKNTALFLSMLNNDLSSGQLLDILLVLNEEYKDQINSKKLLNKTDFCQNRNNPSVEINELAFETILKLECISSLLQY